MNTASIAELKNNLSAYLRQVRRGEEILIRHRKIPVAKIVPLAHTDDYDAELQELVAKGWVKLPEKEMDWDAFWALPRPRLSRTAAKRLARSLADAIVAGREEGY